jgi:hypothetical protein
MDRLGQNGGYAPPRAHYHHAGSLHSVVRKYLNHYHHAGSLHSVVRKYLNLVRPPSPPPIHPHPSTRTCQQRLLTSPPTRRYYLGDLLKLIGYHDSNYIQKINVSIACWSLFCGVTVSLLVTKIRRRVMYLACTLSLLCCYTAWTVAMQKSQTASKGGTPNQAANIATMFFIYAYSPCYNMGYNALTYTYMVEIWPYAERSRGISVFQLFGRLASFFTTFVNPIGLDSVGWKYLISYCCWLAYEVIFVYFFFPETFGRTLEELAFSKLPQFQGCVRERRRG